MREVKDSPGPGHDGSGGVVVTPFYAKQHQPPNQQGHAPLGPPHPLVRPLPPGMRGSPAPPGAASGTPPAHMAPAVGAPSNVMPSHPGSNQAEGNPRMHAPGYPPANPHMPGAPPGAHGYPSKMGHMGAGPSGPGYGQPGYQHPVSHQYPGSRPPAHMMQPYPQGYPAGSAPGSQGPPSPMPPGHQYPPRPPNQSYAYPHYSQPSWAGQGPPTSGMPGGPSMMGGAPGMPGKPPGHMPGQQSQAGANNIVGRTPLYIKSQMQHKLGAYPGPGHQMYPNGPSMPPMMNNRENIQNSMPPPTSASQLAMDGESHPSNTVNSISNNLPNNVNSSNNPTQIGPDGNPVVDEGSQTSTVSNNSAASGDDRATPKLHKDPMMMGQMMGVPMGMSVAPPHMSQHPPTPKNCAPSPGTASMTPQMDENDSMSSPGWPRSPAAPSAYVNNQPPPPTPEIYRTTKAGDSLLRLYEMSDSPDRKLWLDKLLRFMEDNKTPITTCPTISKNPLDLYALYLHVREKGGFEEITKNKQWKDVAAVMGIGASSGGSYTLRKHYMKHILSYECKFDRGGIDPLPIINQIESSQKKKSTKSISVPSPVGSNSSSMDGFTNGPHMGGGPGMGSPYPQYPPSSEYSGHMQQRPSNQPSGYQGMPGPQYPGYQVMHGGPYGTGFPNAGFNPERGYQQTGQSPAGYGYQQPPGYPRTGYPPAGQQPYPTDQYGTMPNSSSAGSYGNSQLARQLLNPPRNPVPINQQYQNNSMYPPKPGPSPSPVPQAPPATQGSYPQPRRHPDFDKAQTWRPPNSQYPPGFGGPPSQGPPPPQQPWPRPDSAPQAAPPQWNPTRYPQPPPQSFPNQQQWNSSPYAQRKPTPVPGQKVFPLTQTSFKSTGYGAYMGKQLFPMDSVEAVSPILIKRRRMGKSDLNPMDPWRILMSLRCGLAAEVTWALDVLNILLFDDKSIVYFGLNDMPGLLEVLIEHLRRGLINMFNICTELELGRDDEATGANKRVKAELCDGSDHPWYLVRPSSPSLELDLGTSEDDFCSRDKDVILNSEDFTLTTRTGKTVRIWKREAQLFMKKGVRDWDKWEGFDSGVDTWSVGGGECTAHLICSMQSSVPTLPFTRLLATVEKASTTDSVTTPPVTVDKVEVVVTKSSPTPSPETVKEEPASPAPLPEKVEATIPKPVDAPLPEKAPSPLDTTKISALPKDSVAKSIFGGKSRKGKGSLDAILKRIKKGPSESSIPSSKFGTQKDSKSILDHYLITDEQKLNTGDETENLALPEPVVKPMVKSPTKLPSLSPIKISEPAESPGSRRDSAGFKRPYEHLEEESWGPDEASLSTTTEGQDWLGRRVAGVGTVIRNLSFIPGNEDVMSKSAPLLALLGKTILLHHTHPSRFPNTQHYAHEDETEFGDWCTSLAPDTYWWWPYLTHVQESTLVTLANISGYLDLSYYPEEISRPILNGLLHWTTCPASYGQDPLAGGSPLSALSPQRLALEALVKLCVLDSNTDLVLATPPFSRLDMLCCQLTRMLCRGEDQVLREFSINIFHYFSAADTGVARVIAMQNGCVSLLTSFIEEAECRALAVAGSQGVAALKETPELMGTSLDMVRRAASTLVNLSRVPDNARVLVSCEQRLLTLVMSQILDTYVASQLSQVLFNVAQTNEGPERLISSPSLLQEEDPAKDSFPLVSKEFDSQTMESLRNIENKSKATQVIPETESPKKMEPETMLSERHATSASHETPSKVQEEDKPSQIIAAPQESVSGPSSPASLPSHPSVSPSPSVQSNIADSAVVVAPPHPMNCSTTPSGVGTKVASPQATPTL